jgi:hypothetical protein
MLYSLAYNNVRQNVNLTEVNDRSTLDLLPNNYYEYPQFSQLSLSIGVNKVFKKDWSLTGMLSSNIVDDFFKPKLRTSFNIQSLAYVEKEHNENLSYGIGLFLGQTEKRLIPSVALSFNYQNKKRGIEVLFPSNIRMWQIINKVSYLEINVNSNFYSISYKPNNSVSSMDIISIIPGLTYNYIWQDFLRFKVGVDLPYNDVAISSKDEILTYKQFSMGFKVGLSIVID